MTKEVTKDAEEPSNGEAAVLESESTEKIHEPKVPETVSETAASPEQTRKTEIEAAPAEEPLAESLSTPELAVAPASAAEPAAVEESQAVAEIDFGAILEQFEQEQTVFHSGELVTGTVVGITDRGVMVDFGYKSEGFVPVEEFTDPDGEMKVSVGETVEVVIRSILSGDSAPQLSRVDALGQKVWDELEVAFQSETPVTGRVVDKTKGGLRLDLNGLEAFLPGSQIDSRPIRSLDGYIGQDIEARIIKFSRRRSNIVLSRKVLTDEVVNALKSETLSTIEVGYIVDGEIKNLTEYGAFVDIGGIDGLLHVTDMSWGRLHHPGDQFKVADHIQVKVLKLDREKGKVSLGYKQLLPDPWSTVVEVYPVDTRLKGTVSSVTEYGVFVELEAGVEGLVHVSEISWSRRPQNPTRVYHKGQEIEVQVLGVDTVERRISLGIKQFQENPWDRIDEKYPVGSKIRGRVRNITEFGAFVEVEDGIDGLVHISDMSWAKKIRHPRDVLRKDQEVDAIITSIDKRGQRLSLSIKDLTPSTWEGFVATHRPGDVVKGKVSRFTNFGIFVELGDGLEGLCHISELSDERVDRAEDIAELGQEMEFKILRIESAEQKVGLSHRVVGKADEPVSDAKMYSSEAKGGMASLGELANLKLTNAPEEPVAAEEPEVRKKLKASAKKAKSDKTAKTEAVAETAAVAEQATLTSEKSAVVPEAVAADTPETPVDVSDPESVAAVPATGAKPVRAKKTANKSEAATESDTSEGTIAEPVAEDTVAESEQTTVETPAAADDTIVAAENTVAATGDDTKEEESEKKTA